MKITKRQRKYLLIGIAIIAAIWSIVGGKVLAASLLQTPNISTGEPAINRAVACSQTTFYCYIMGGGADSGTKSDVVSRYNRNTNVVDTSTALPDDVPFSNYVSGAYSHYIIAIGNPDFSNSVYAYVYNENTQTWSRTNISGDLVNENWGYAGVAVGQYFYIFTLEPTSGIFTAARLDITNATAGASTVSQTSGFTGYIVQWAKSVYDPESNHVLLFNRDNGLLISYNVGTSQAFGTAGTFTPCDSTTLCQPSLAFYDNNLGLVAGKQGDISSTTIGLYQFDWDTTTFSSSTVEILSNANFNSSQFTADDVFQPNAGSVTGSDGITQTFFGSSITNLANPGYNANMFWLRTGDPGGVTTTRNDFDSWLDHFLSGIGMNSDLGKLLVGSLFVGIIFLVLAIRGVPWIVSLAVSGIAVVMLTAATVFSATILLSLMALVMFAGILMLMSLIFGRGGDG